MRRQARLTHCVAEKRVMRTIERGEYNSIAPHGASSMMAAARQSQHMLLKKMIRRVLGDNFYVRKKINTSLYDYQREGVLLPGAALP